MHYVTRYIGRDLAWFALDTAGHVAVFTTAGIAPIPSAVLEHPELIESAEALSRELPPVGDSRLLVQLPCPDDYIAFARRGFYAYNWRDAHRTSGFSRRYEIIAQPEVCRTVENLGARLQAAARLVEFEVLLFASADSIQVEQLVACENARQGTAVDRRRN
jgi:hypothetical protein